MGNNRNLVGKPKTKDEDKSRIEAIKKLKSHFKNKIKVLELNKFKWGWSQSVEISLYYFISCHSGTVKFTMDPKMFFLSPKDGMSLATEFTEAAVIVLDEFGVDKAIWIDEMDDFPGTGRTWGVIYKTGTLKEAEKELTSKKLSDPFKQFKIGNYNVAFYPDSLFEKEKNHDGVGNPV